MKVQAGQIWRRPDATLFRVIALDGLEAVIEVIRAGASGGSVGTQGTVPSRVILTGWRKMGDL